MGCNPEGRRCKEIYPAPEFARLVYAIWILSAYRAYFLRSKGQVMGASSQDCRLHAQNEQSMVLVLPHLCCFGKQKRKIGSTSPILPLQTASTDLQDNVSEFLSRACLPFAADWSLIFLVYNSTRSTQRLVTVSSVVTAQCKLQQQCIAVSKKKKERESVFK